jgi:hypothetical protein
MTEYADKLRSLHFSVRPPTHKQTMQGDTREGTMTTESADRQDVQVFIPPVTVEMDMPMVGEIREEAADRNADQARQAKENQ